MINQIRKLFSRPSAEVLALRELEDSKRCLLEAQTNREYSESMVKFREAQIKQLTTYIKGIES